MDNGFFVQWWFVFFRKVHITQATLDCLNDEFAVEPGHGAERNEYIRKDGIQTYFIADSEVEKAKVMKK